MPVFKNVFITGASSGIGHALSLELARRGSRVVATARRQDRLDELVRAIRDAGGQADGVALDVRDHDSLRSVMEHWDGEVGGFDLVIANAGVVSNAPRDSMVWEQAENVVAVNFTAALATLLLAKELMRPRGLGTLAGTSSLAGLRGLPGSGAYSATKAGLQAFLEGLELELQGSGLRVVDIQPGFVRSEITDGNNFNMPFLWEVERAARVCADGLEAKRSVIHFPWQLSWPMRLAAALLPRPLWRILISRALPTR
jgi:NAD(P)-dependent dehydrogenase (short-subunit alcohol dehydrogenase family)